MDVTGCIDGVSIPIGVGIADVISYIGGKGTDLAFGVTDVNIVVENAEVHTSIGAVDASHCIHHVVTP